MNEMKMINFYYGLLKSRGNLTFENLPLQLYTVQLNGKLTVPQSSILKTRFSILDSRKLRGSRLESSLETFEAFQEFIKTVREFMESSFETFEWEKQRTFRAINF